MKNYGRRISAQAVSLGLVSVLASGAAVAGTIEQTWVGTWDSTGSGNPGPSGPGMSVGQKYVIKFAYDDTSAVANDVPVLNDFFASSGQFMSTVDLSSPGNSLNIFVPMEGLDAGSPFIYTQDQSNHFPAYIPAPTLNFTNNSDISNAANIIGLEFEGDFVPGGNFNLIELYNTTPGAATPINMVSQVLNCSDAFCTSSAVAATSTNGLASAVPVVATDTTVTYSAADLVKTTSLAVQSNDLGAGRSDGETFLDGAWDVPGSIQPNGVDIEVAIADSGLVNTGSTATWNVEVTEEMTDLSDTAQALVDYANASPTASLSATANATGYDFALAFADLDEAVNALIAGFEVVSAVSAMVDSVATTFFDMLLNTGLQDATHTQLEAAFGLGNHLLLVTGQDLAGAIGTATVSFNVEDSGQPPVIPVPATLLLMLLGLALMGWRRAVTQ